MMVKVTMMRMRVESDRVEPASNRNRHLSTPLSSVVLLFFAMSANLASVALEYGT